MMSFFHEAAYAELYHNEPFKKKQGKKLKQVLASLQPDQVTKALADNEFWRQVDRCYYQYPQPGGRHYLYLLVGK